ncbi:hypothetical protein CRM22_000329 [Opisthorchis felineus]|uniref:Uncharacterized protein n=1 Tax=Opisthorchis felineus TaxID=147828 RepID=A0A4S2MFG5_OPIFE|nr:hypothetical protein CRM22_000329 [Opisthorchis felineus]
MPQFHYCEGACADVTVSLPPDFDCVVRPHRLHRACLLLQQPSPIWKEFSIHSVRFFSDYMTQSVSPEHGSSDKITRAEVTSDQQNPQLDELLHQVCTLAKLRRENQLNDLTTECEISDIGQSLFDAQ